MLKILKITPEFLKNLFLSSLLINELQYSKFLIMNHIKIFINYEGVTSFKFTSLYWYL